MKPLALLISLVITSQVLISQPNSNYQLVFFDDFNQPTLSDDWNKVDCEPHGTEQQLYMKENVYIESSNLVLIGKKEPVSCNNLIRQYTSGEVNLAHFLYGYFEIRAWVPGGCGAWPAFWFWSGGNDTQYSELDVMDFCGTCCDKYKTGYIWDDNNNGIAEGLKNSDHLLNNGGWNNVNSICSGYNTYGMEWTPTHIKWYHNGVLIQQTYNYFSHQPLALILNLAFGDFENCMSCNFEESEFPRYYVIDYVKIFKETNTAITLKSEVTDICVGQETIVYAPIFGGGAVYDWTYNETALEITEKVEYVGIKASEKPGFQGSWKSVKVKGLTPGNHSLQLTITFPSGYVETKHIAIYVTNQLPQPQEWIQDEFVEEPTCCYKVSTNLNNDAISYVWTITPLGGIHPNSFQIESPTNQLDYCFEIRKNFNISVQAKNLCGLSEPINDLFFFPTPPPCDRLVNNRFRISPNPSDGNIVISIVNESTNLPIPHIDNQIYIIDYLGNIKYTIEQPTNPISINLSHLDNGLYRAVTNNQSSVLQESFILNKE